jgi:NADH-quinone oxidoreductase subunit N
MITGVIAAQALHLPHVNYTTIMPELILLGGMLVLLLVSALFKKALPRDFYATSVVGVGVASLIASLVLYHDVASHGPFTAIAHSIDIDGFSVLFLTLVSCIMIVYPFFAHAYLQREGLDGVEFFALPLISGAGAMFMASANDLILIFLGLEILSLPLYVMAGMDQRREASGEAAMKYFIMGAFSSAIFLYGMALTYGATGSLNLAEISAFLAKNYIFGNGVLLAGMGLLLIGFLFKIAAVPFHYWSPDVYQGSPTIATGFMAAIAKAGAFAAMIRVFMATFPTLASDWQPLLWVIVVLTTLFGAVVALVQKDVKRMLAYSSINQAGFILLGLQADTSKGIGASLYYVFIYSFLILGTFAVVAIAGARGDAIHDIDDLRGYAKSHPFLATSLAIFLVAQAGAPFTTGFLAKLQVVTAAIDAHSYALAVIAMISAAIATGFYLRIVYVMFGDGTDTRVSVPAEKEVYSVSPLGQLGVSPWLFTGIVLCLSVTILFGFWPQPLVDFATHAKLLFV